MTVTWQDLEDAQERRHNLLDEYVLDIATTTSPTARLAMAKAHTTWSRWVRDFDYDSDHTTNWAGVLDYFPHIEGPTMQRLIGPSIARTSLYAGVLASIDNELLKKELVK